jgi:hypothetical protein
MPQVFTAAPDGAIAVPHRADADAHFRNWQSHLEAGRLAAAAKPTRPEIIANRACTEAILRAHAAAIRAAHRAGEVWEGR